MVVVHLCVNGRPSTIPIFWQNFYTHCVQSYRERVITTIDDALVEYNGKYTFDFENDFVTFETEEDRVAFVLTWS
jgi:hypothetical protein